MFSKSACTGLTVAIALFVGATARPASAASPDDACSLVTEAQVSAAVGVPMGAGSHVTPTYLKTCTWAPTGGPTKEVASVTVSLQPPGSYASAKNFMEAAQARSVGTKGGGAAPLANESASGIGDDAFYTSMGSSYTALLVKKGSAVFKIAIYGAMPAQQAKAKEKALALQVLSKL